MVSFLFIVCCAIAYLALPVKSDGNDFDEHFSAYSPGIIQDVWHVPDFFAIPKEGDFLNEIPPLYTSDWFASGFPMPYDIQSLLERRRQFSLRVMKSSWREPADTNVFVKGDTLYLQVSASPAPGQQLYVQSCHASSSPNHADKPVVPLIINKGCVASKESLVKFVFQRSDAVNMIVRTSILKLSEVYLHCRVLLTNSDLTSVTKFCNYNKLKSRWVDLSGQTSVCDCCGRRCRNSIERVELPVSLETSAVLSTGPLIIRDEQSSQPTPSDYSIKSSPIAGNMRDKRWIMAGASFSGRSKQNNVSPWPVQPGYGGGVVVINQGQGRDLSMWLPDIMGLELNPVVQAGIGYPEKLAVDVMLQHEDFRVLKPEENVESLPVALAEDEKNAEAVVWKDVEKPVEAEADHPEPHLNFESVFDMPLNDQSSVNSTLDELSEGAKDHPEPHLNFESVFDMPLNDQSSVNSTLDELSEGAKDKGEAVFRQAEMVFKSDQDAKLPEPVLYSKLSVNQAADGSSSLNYEERKRPSVGNGKMQLEKDGEKKKDEGNEVTFSIKDLVSALLEQLRRLWTAE